MSVHSFDYAIIRVVPRVEREEFVNAGVILYCREVDFLAARVALDPVRLQALAPGADLAVIESALAAFPRICAGEAGAGPIAGLPQADRFHWLVAPRSTIAQTSPVHSGLCGDPEAMIEHLVATVVRV